jgi:hypothetical protein
VRPKLTDTLILALATLLHLPQSALSWSSSASRTQADLKNLAAALEVFKNDAGQYPAPEHYWLELKNKDLLYHRDQSGPLNDRWDRPVIYRRPGKQHAFDLYSVGPDGIDNNGTLDDVWENGVNDGFHWKETWPAGRRTLRLTAGFALASLLLAFVWPWRIIAPLVGMILCVGTIAGCRLLMHPGVVSSRNQPLQLYILLAALLFGVLLVALALSIWKARSTRHRPNSAASTMF